MKGVEERHVFNDGGTVLRKRHIILVMMSRRLVMGKGDRQVTGSKTQAGGGEGGEGAVAEALGEEEAGQGGCRSEALPPS